MLSKTRRRIRLELLLPPPLWRPLLARKQLLQCPVSFVPSVAETDTLLSVASSLQSPARRQRTKYSNRPPTRKIDALIARAKPMRPRMCRLLLSLQERQVFVFPPPPAPCLTPGTQTQGPLLI